MKNDYIWQPICVNW